MEHTEVNQLRYDREHHGYTQAMLRHLLGFKDGSWISRWEKGWTVPTLKSAIKLSLLLDAPLGELFNNLAEEVCETIRTQAAVVSSMSEVPGVPQTIEQPETLP